jgi:hypothetical protein
METAPKLAPPDNPRQLTPQFAYAIRVCYYGWTASLDENGVQSKSLAPAHVWANLPEPTEGAPLYQVHELPIL